MTGRKDTMADGVPGESGKTNLEDQFQQDVTGAAPGSKAQHTTPDKKGRKKARSHIRRAGTG
jgi:hypothetical protein